MEHVHVLSWLCYYISSRQPSREIQCSFSMIVLGFQWRTCHLRPTKLCCVEVNKSPIEDVGYVDLWRYFTLERNTSSFERWPSCYKHHKRLWIVVKIPLTLARNSNSRMISSTIEDLCMYLWDPCHLKCLRHAMIFLPLNVLVSRNLWSW